MAKKEDRVLVEDPKTGMQIFIPASKLRQKPIQRTPEQETKARENFNRAWERVKQKIYGGKEEK